MALIFPRDMTSSRCWIESRFKLMHRTEHSPQAGGKIQALSLGPSLWRAEFATVALLNVEADEVIADFDTLFGALRPFYATPPRRRRPLSTFGQTGDIAGVTVAAVRVDNQALSLSGLPAGFVLSAGDFLSVTTAAGGREFFRIARGGTADGLGDTPDLEVAPHVRPSVVAGDAVTLVDPQVEMFLEPGSLDDAYAGPIRRIVSFSAVQVIR